MNPYDPIQHISVEGCDVGAPIEPDDDERAEAMLHMLLTGAMIADVLLHPRETEAAIKAIGQRMSETLGALLPAEDSL